MKEYIIKVDDEKPDIMGNMPLVEKAKELVRCKDCAFGEKVNAVYLCGKSRSFGVVHDPLWFCADGEHKPTQTNTQKSALDVR